MHWYASPNFGKQGSLSVSAVFLGEEQPLRCVDQCDVAGRDALGVEATVLQTLHETSENRVIPDESHHSRFHPTSCCSNTISPHTSSHLHQAATQRRQIVYAWSQQTAACVPRHIWMADVLQHIHIQDRDSAQTTVGCHVQWDSAVDWHGQCMLLPMLSSRRHGYRHNNQHRCLSAVYSCHCHRCEPRKAMACPCPYSQTTAAETLHFCIWPSFQHEFPVHRSSENSPENEPLKRQGVHTFLQLMPMPTPVSIMLNYAPVL